MKKIMSLLKIEWLPGLMQKINWPRIHIPNPVLVAVITGICIIIAAIINKPAIPNNEEFIHVVLSVYDKNSGKPVEGVEIKSKSLNIPNKTDRDGNLNFRISKNIEKVITMQLTVPVDSTYFILNDDNSIVYDTINVKK